MQLNEIRSKYPQYQDISDQQLAEALHKKHYPDMDFAEFSQRVGYSQPVEAQPEVDFSFGEMLGNIPSSAGKLVTDLATPIMHPMDTAEALGSLALGGIDKGAEELASALPEGVSSSINKFNNYLVDMGVPLERLPDDPENMTFENTKYADNMINVLSERYGSMDAFQQTLMNDPVGVVSDVAGVLTGGGSLIPKVGGKVSKFGAMIDPLNAATRGAAKGLSNIPGIKNLPEHLYQSAAKFSTTKSPRQRAAMTKTALENKIMPRTAGVDKAREIIGKYNDEIDSLIDASVNKGEKIKRSSLYTGLKKVRQKLGGVNLDAADDLAKINNIVRKFERHLNKKGGKEFLSPKEVQNLKKNIYKKIDYKKKKLKGTLAGTDTRKAIAKSAKEELESIIPEIKGLNAKEGKMLELVEAIEKSASRIENRDMIGIGIPLKATAGGVAGGLPGAIAGFTAGVLDAPTVKAKLALVLHEIQRMDISDARKLVISGQLTKLAGRNEQIEEEPSN